MNAFGYAGQQTINQDGTVTDNPSAPTGTWASANGLSSKGSSTNSSSLIHSYQSGMNAFFGTNSSDNS